MDRRTFLKQSAGAAMLAGSPSLLAADVMEDLACDVLVHGSTPGGLAAAIEASRGGCKVDRRQ